MASGHVDKGKSPKPLTVHAWAALDAASISDVPGYYHNPGVWDRLSREGLVDQVWSGGKRLYRATDAGRAKLKERP